MSTTPTKYTATERQLAHELASRTGADWRTALRAIQQGPGVIRTMMVRSALTREMSAMGIRPGGGRTP